MSIAGEATESDREVYLVKGYPGWSKDRQEYEIALDRLRRSHPELFTRVRFHVYGYDGWSEDGTHQLAADIGASGGARRIIVGFSAGVGRIKELVGAGVAFDWVITIDGFSEGTKSPIQIDFTGKPVDHVLNYLSDDWLIHGTSHVCGVGQCKEFKIKLQHTQMLKYFTDDFDGVTWVAQRAGEHGGGVGGVGGGGVESWPPWLPAGWTRPPGGLSRWPGAGRCASPGILAQLVPVTGPRGQSGMWVTPKDALELGDAISVLGMDYPDTATHVPTAAVFGAETAGAVYIHDYPVCRRLQDYALEGVAPLAVDGVWWWMVRAVHPTDGSSEYFIPLTVIVSGAQARVDSRYLMDYFPASIPGTILNYAIWAADPIDAVQLLESFLDNVASTYAIQYDNASPPPQPTVYARSAGYGNGFVYLTLWNSGESANVRCFGTTWREPRQSAAALFDTTFTVSPESTEVALPTGRIHDAIVYLDTGGFLDKVYVAGGYWFAFDDSGEGGTSQVSMTTGELLHPPIPNMDSTLVCPPRVEMHGYVTDALSWGYIGVGYAFQRRREAIDLSGHEAVAFYCRGDGGTYAVKLETAGITDNDYYLAQFQAPPGWTLVTIPFSSFHQGGWGTPVAWTGQDVRTISFVTTGRPLTSVEMAVDRISFKARPTSVDPMSLVIEAIGDEVLVSWRTAEDDEPVGYHVLRGESAAFPAAVRLNSTVLPSGRGEYRYVDSEVPAGEHWYWVEEIDRWGRAIPYGPRHVSIPSVAGRVLLGAAPNPFTRSTVITFTLARPELVTARVYDPRGRVIRILADRLPAAAGRCSLTWDGRDREGGCVAFGVYFCRIQTGRTLQQVKLLFAPGN